jgi:hypothetical protein
MLVPTYADVQEAARGSQLRSALLDSAPLQKDSGQLSSVVHLTAGCRAGGYWLALRSLSGFPTHSLCLLHLVPDVSKILIRSGHLANHFVVQNVSPQTLRGTFDKLHTEGVSYMQLTPCGIFLFQRWLGDDIVLELLLVTSAIFLQLSSQSLKTTSPGPPKTALRLPLVNFTGCIGRESD